LGQKGWSPAGLSADRTMRPVVTSGEVVCGNWTTLLPDTANLSRGYHAMIYDPVRDRLLVFGGVDLSKPSFESVNDVWATPHGGTPAWTAVAATGTPPPARYDHTAIYDPVRDRLIVFGGQGTGGLLNDVWALALSGTPAWTQISAAGTPPTGRAGHSAIYDATRDRMVVFGGFDGTGRLQEEW